MSALLILLALLLCAAPAALVLVYVAYPQRGEEPPRHLRWLGNVLASSRRRLPVLSEEDGDRMVAARR